MQAANGNAVPSGANPCGGRELGPPGGTAPRGLRAPRSPIGIRNTRKEILRILAEQHGLSGAEIYERIPPARRARRNKVYERLGQLRTKGEVERDDEGS